MSAWQDFAFAPRDRVFLGAIRHFNQDCYVLVHWNDRRQVWMDGADALEKLPHCWCPLPLLPDCEACAGRAAA